MPSTKQKVQKKLNLIITALGRSSAETKERAAEYALTLSKTIEKDMRLNKAIDNLILQNNPFYLFSQKDIVRLVPKMKARQKKG